MGIDTPAMWAFIYIPAMECATPSRKYNTCTERYYWYFSETPLLRYLNLRCLNLRCLNSMCKPPNHKHNQSEKQRAPASQHLRTRLRQTFLLLRHNILFISVEDNISADPYLHKKCGQKSTRKHNYAIFLNTQCVLTPHRLVATACSSLVRCNG